MAITLRNNKGASLTYEELDLNFHNFFYSASVSSDSKQLTLHYTGSALQSAGGVNIALNTYTGSSEVAGNVNEFQYNLDGTNFAGASGLVYDSAVNGVGIGTTSLNTGEKFRVEGGNVVLEDSSLYVAQGNLSGSISYGGTTRDMSIRNWHVDNNSDIVFFAGGEERFRIKGDGTLTQNGADSSLGSNVLSGSIIFGKTLEDTYRSKLMTWDSANLRIENNNTYNLLRGNERGIILEGPQTGQVVVGVQSTSGNEGFSIISAPPTSSDEPTYNKLVANFAANGSVGIGTSDTPTGYLLTVSGSISGSAGMYIAGNTVVSGSLTSRSNLFVDQATTLSGSVTLNTVNNAASATNYDFLVRETNGNVAKQVNAAPIPVGGIIMWSGTIATIPSGWSLCNGTNNTPDLRNKFIVGAHSDLSGTAKSNIEGASNFNQTGGDISHNHGGNTGNHTLNSSQIPSHYHNYKDSYYIEYNNPAVGGGGAIGGVDYVGPTAYKGSGDSDGDNRYVYYRNMTTNSTGGQTGHNHSISTDNHLPPYFALAYIMYTG